MALLSRRNRKGSGDVPKPADSTGTAKEQEKSVEVGAEEPQDDQLVLGLRTRPTHDEEW